MGGGAGLKDRRRLERPGRAGIELPGGMRGDHATGLREITAVIGTKIEASPLPRPRRQGMEKRGLDQAVLMVPPLWPGVGKKDENLAERRARRQRLEKIVRRRVEKMQVAECSPVALALGPGNPFGLQIEPQTELFGMRRGISGEEMAVAAADLAGKAPSRRQHFCQRLAQVRAAARDEVLVGRTGRGGWHEVDDECNLQ